MKPKLKTQGVTPKVPITAIVTVLAFILSYWTIELPPGLAAAIALLLGGGAGYQTPPAAVELER